MLSYYARMAQKLTVMQLINKLGSLENVVKVTNLEVVKSSFVIFLLLSFFFSQPSRDVFRGVIEP